MNGGGPGTFAKIEGVRGPDNADEGELLFYTAINNTEGPIERMRIRYNGNVGIGTTGANREA